MAWTTADLESIEAALVAGEDTVIINGKTIEYKTNRDMMQTYNAIKRYLNVDDGTAKPYSTAKFV